MKSIYKCNINILYQYVTNDCIIMNKFNEELLYITLYSDHGNGD